MATPQDDNKNTAAQGSTEDVGINTDVSGKANSFNISDSQSTASTNTSNANTNTSVKKIDVVGQRDKIEGMDRLTKENADRWKSLLKTSKQGEDYYTDDEWTKLQNEKTQATAAGRNEVVDIDVLAGTDLKKALHKMVLPDELELNLNDTEKVDIDVTNMAKVIYEDDSLTADQKYQYTRALNIVANMHEQGFGIIRNNKTKRYWIERPDGQAKYVANGIVEVADLIDDYIEHKENEKPEVVPDTVPEKKEEKKEDVVPLIPDIVVQDDEMPEAVSLDMSEQDMLRFGAFGVDFVTSLAGMGIKLAGYSTGAGAGYGQVIGGAVSIIGGLVSTGMETYANFTDENVSFNEALKQAGIRVGLEVIEGTTFVPASVVGKLGKATKYGRYVRNIISYGMAAGQIDQLAGVEWKKLLDKDVSDYTTEDFQNIGSMMLTVMSVAGAGVSRHMARKQTRMAGIEVETTRKNGAKAVHEEINATKGKGKVTGENELIKQKNKAIVEGSKKKVAVAEEVIDANGKKLKEKVGTELSEKEAKAKTKIDELGKTVKSKETIAKEHKAKIDLARKQAKAREDAINKGRKKAKATRENKYEDIAVEENSRLNKLLNKRLETARTKAKKGTDMAALEEKITNNTLKQSNKSRIKKINKTNEEYSNTKKQLDSDEAASKAAKKKDYREAKVGSKKDVNKTNKLGTEESRKKLKEKVSSKVKDKKAKAEADIDNKGAAEKKLVAKKIGKRTANKLGKVDRAGQKSEKVKNASRKTNKHEEKVAEKVRVREAVNKRNKREHSDLGEESSIKSGYKSVKGAGKKLVSKVKGIGESKVRKKKRVEAEIKRTQESVKPKAVEVKKNNAIHSARIKDIDSNINKIESKYKKAGKKMPERVQRHYHRLKVEKQNLQHRIKQNSYELDAANKRASKKIAELKGENKPKSTKDVVKGLKDRQSEINQKIKDLKNTKGKKSKKEIKQLKKEHAAINDEIKKQTSLVAKSGRAAKKTWATGKAVVTAPIKVAGKTVGAGAKAARKSLNTYNKGVARAAVANSQAVRNISGTSEKDRAEKAKKRIALSGYKVDKNMSDGDVLRLYNKLVKDKKISDKQRKSDALDDFEKKNKLVKKKGRYVIKKRTGGVLRYNVPVFVRKAQQGYTNLESRVEFLVQQGKYREAQGEVLQAKMAGAVSPEELAAVSNLLQGKPARKEQPVTPVTPTTPTEEVNPNAEEDAIIKQLEDLAAAGKYDEANKLLEDNKDKIGDPGFYSKMLEQAKMTGAKTKQDVINNAPSPGLFDEKNKKVNEKGDGTSAKESVVSLLPKTSESNPYKPNYMDLATYLKPSDLLAFFKGKKSKEFNYNIRREQVSSPRVPLVRNMIGFNRDMNATKILPTVNGNFYDTMNANTKNFNASLQARNAKSTENAKYVDSREDMARKVLAEHDSKLDAAENRFRAKMDNADKEYAISAKADWEKRRDWRDKLEGRLTNDLFRTGQYMYNKKINHDANDLLVKKDLWNSKYKPQIDAYTKDGKTDEITKLENEFYTKEGVNPYELDSKLRALKEKAATSPNPYNVT